MPVEIYTPRDPLWVASMRARYASILSRRSRGAEAHGDDTRLIGALESLNLSPADFEADVALLASGRPCDRADGRWPDDAPFDVRIEDETQAIEVTGTNL